MSDYYERQFEDLLSLEDEREEIEDSEPDTASDIIFRLDRDRKEAARMMTKAQARFFVGQYYTAQENRKRTMNQMRQLRETDQPNSAQDYLNDKFKAMEAYIKACLMQYVKGKPLGLWCMSHTGIGPVITSGLMSHIDIERAKYAGQIWSYAGLNPGIEWLKGQKRPFNADLKLLCWKIGESFVKFSGREDCFYGHIYKERKAWEWKQNLSGNYAEEARKKLSKFAIGKDTDAFKWYSGTYCGMELKDKVITGIQGSVVDGIEMLPPAHIYARSKRVAVKLFLAHFHAVCYRLHFREREPVPYSIAILGHQDYIPPGHMEVLEDYMPADLRRG
jgi:hypothetical protein